MHDQVQALRRGVAEGLAQGVDHGLHVGVVGLGYVGLPLAVGPQVLLVDDRAAAGRPGDGYGAFPGLGYLGESTRQAIEMERNLNDLKQKLAAARLTVENHKHE